MAVSHQIRVIVMAFAPLLTGMLCLTINLVALRQCSSRAEHLARIYQSVLTLIASLISLVSTLSLIDSLLAGQQLVFDIGTVRVYALDALSLSFALLVNVVTLAASASTGKYLESELQAGSNSQRDIGWFYLLFNLFHVTMLLVSLVDNLVWLWIAVELTTYASTFLIGYRRDRRALEAAWKYIIITSTGIIFALLGTVFLASAINDPRLPMSWSQLVAQPNALDPNFVWLSFLFVLIGYGTKAGIAPMHTWLPDGHGEAPFPISALLSGVLLKCAVYAILRFYTITNVVLGSTKPGASQLLIWTGLFSLMLATPFIVKRNRFKRILAYHSLEHIGIIIFGVGIGGVGLFGALLHTFNHALVKTLMFLAFGNVQINYSKVKPGEYDDQYVGVLQAMPGSGALLAVGGLALVGAPPFSLFFSELLILEAAVRRALHEPSAWLLFAVALFLISVAVIFGGLVQHISRMLLDRPPPDVMSERIWQVWPLILLALPVLLNGLAIFQIGEFDLAELLLKSVQVVQQGSQP